jgi:tetratricopeptide (TPR) repeat protein
MSKYRTILPILLLTLITTIPITLAQQNPKPTTTNPTIPIQKYTGIVKRVDDIAQQITVRIENKDGNGSGVIIGREGNTYTAITAAHIVGEKQEYSLITPSQERIALKAEQITILNKDLDIALVKFTSTQNYRTAELANYQFRQKDWVFTPGFPGIDSTKRRYLSIGEVQNREQTEFLVKDRSTLRNGNNLIYTNLSLPGMGGGAVLDRQGRLVGINIGSEDQQIINENNYQVEQIKFGYGLGISTSTILAALNQSQISTAQLKIATTPASNLALGERQKIKQYQLAALSAPSQNSSAKQWLDYGNLLWRSSQHQQAITAFDRSISSLQTGTDRSSKEQLTLAYIGKGLALKEQNQHQQAVTAFRAAIAIDPQLIQAWRYQGQSLSKLQQYPEALISCQKAIELDPQNFVLHIEKGDVLNNLKRYPESLESYHRAIRLEPKYPWTYHRRGRGYIALKQYSKAKTDLEQAARLFQADGDRANYQAAMKSLKQLAQLSK